jgi:hypothetical protein
LTGSIFRIQGSRSRTGSFRAVYMTRMKWFELLATAVILSTGCSDGATATPNASPSPENLRPSAEAIVVPGGCGSTPVFLGGKPAWIDAATAHNAPPVAYVLGKDGMAVGLMFINPLRAGPHPENPSNKVIWAVRQLRDRSDLQISGHPVGATKPTLHQSQAAGAPGEGTIFRSVVDVPDRGCWHFDLSWGGHSDAVELDYQ